MEILKGTIINISVCSIISAIVLLFVEKESFKKALRVLLSLTMITIIITPLISNEGLKREIFHHYKQVEDESFNSERKRLNESLLKDYEIAVITIIDDLLSSMGISGHRVKVKANGYGEYGINISKASIYLKDEYKKRHTEIEDTISKEIGFAAEIFYE
ncbi:MAG TPA: hypothetical protein VFC76_07500 [Oscillospiraceae bacterium]|nr:hypothetical protein [Oscillospiraceae bacterium]